ncbi:hypothetical protein ACHAXA_008302, partial [Cyclostephanos tholiformis]
SKEQAENLKIPLVTLDAHSKNGVVDPDLNLVKGGLGIHNQQNTRDGEKILQLPTTAITSWTCISMDGE